MKSSGSKINVSSCQELHPSLISIHLLFFFFIANATEAERKSFMEELNVMKSLPLHNNVINLLGCVTKSGNSFLPQCKPVLSVIAENTRSHIFTIGIGQVILAVTVLVPNFFC